VPVTVEEIVYHTRAVVRGVRRALVLAKMPYLSISFSQDTVLQTASALVKEAGAQGLEVEGGEEIIPVVRLLVAAGIPVMPHIGLTTQRSMHTGRFTVQAKTASEARGLLELAAGLEGAGAFAVMLECVPFEVASCLSRNLSVPVVGIGSGAGCDGQILVSHDMLGLFDRFVPKFVKRYRNLSEEIVSAFREFKEDVEERRFPAAEQAYSMESEEAQRLEALIRRHRKGKMQPHS
jgi:3-methyl-2-oxobutanoate hydroxymethyltransferase